MTATALIVAHSHASAEAVSTTKEDITLFDVLRLYASPFETRKVGDQVAEFFGRKSGRQAIWHQRNLAHDDLLNIGAPAFTTSVPSGQACATADVPLEL